MHNKFESMSGHKITGSAKSLYRTLYNRNLHLRGEFGHVSATQLEWSAKLRMIPRAYKIAIECMCISSRPREESRLSYNSFTAH